MKQAEGFSFIKSTYYNGDCHLVQGTDYYCVLSKQNLPLFDDQMVMNEDIVIGCLDKLTKKRMSR